MISRHAKDTLLRYAQQFPVIGITGPRQSGKTTLARHAFPDKRYVSFDDSGIRDLAESNPKDFIEALHAGAIIDEAQKVPEIFDALKLYIDNSEWAPGKFILTGSSQFHLKKNMSDSLAGRASFFSLLPFSLQELNEDGALPEKPYELIFNGEYPPLYDPAKHFAPYDWFEAYIDTYVERDVKDLIKADNLSTFKKFIQICALQSGQLLSMESIATATGVSSPTIKAWLSILEASYIIHFLTPDTNNLGRSVVKTPKLYFVDTGLLCHLLRLDTVEELMLSPFKGAVVETFAVSELMKQRMNRGIKPNLTFYRDSHGFEVDVIADWKHTMAIEIKSYNAPENKLSANTRKYLELRGEPEAKASVYYLGDLTLTVNNTKYVGWKDWGKE